MRSVFGWSYPPGVSRLPWDEDTQCDVCKRSSDDCICPECPVCSEAGNPTCYTSPLPEKQFHHHKDGPDHGLKLSKAQLQNRALYAISECKDRIIEHEQYLAWLDEQPNDYQE